FQPPTGAGRRRLTRQLLQKGHCSSVTMTSDLQTQCWRGLFCAAVLQCVGQRSDVYLQEQEAHVTRRNSLKLQDRAPQPATSPLQLGKAIDRCDSLIR